MTEIRAWFGPSDIENGDSKQVYHLSRWVLLSTGWEFDKYLGHVNVKPDSAVATN